jgi:DNA-binding Xre family transcriptional regulator
MYYNKIKTEAENKNLTIKKLADIIGISDAGLYQMIRHESMKIDILEKICKVLGVSPGIFFESGNELNEQQVIYNRSRSGVNNHITGGKNFFSGGSAEEIERLTAENKQLRQELSAAKDKIINLLESLQK